MEMHGLRVYSRGGSPPGYLPDMRSHQWQFILYEPLPEPLEKRLKEAFAGESKAYVRNLAFAEKAGKEAEFPRSPSSSGRWRMPKGYMQMNT